MKVRFKNIGAVKEAEIDLSKKLIVFCGPNNTGKTYLAYCVYLLSKVAFNSDYAYSKPLPNILVNDENDIFKDGKLTVDLYEVYSEYKDKLKTMIENTLYREFPQTFGLAHNSKNLLFSDSKFEIVFDEDSIVKKAIFDDILNAKFNIGNTTILIQKEKSSFKLDVIYIENAENSTLSTSLKDFIILLITSHIFQAITNSFIHKAYIAPVERNSIYTFSKELSIKRNVLVDEMLDLNNQKSHMENPFDLLNRRVTRYPLPIRDGLEVSEDLNNFQKRTSEFADFANKLENEILEGKVIITKEGEIQFSPRRSKKLKLPVHITASIVKSLSSLIVYFRHLAEKDDLIIIDEPELNLHPDAQIKVARIIAQIVNKGFKVLINTHSDYIVRELNNLIMLHSIKENKDKLFGKFGYTNDESLNYEDVNVYLFQYENTRSTSVNVENVDVEETGFEVRSMDQVIEDLNERTQELYFELKG